VALDGLSGRSGDKKKPLAGLNVEEEKKEEKVCCLDRL